MHGRLEAQPARSVLHLRATQLFDALDVLHQGWLELRWATDALASFKLPKKEHERMAMLLERAAHAGGCGSSDQRHVTRKSFLKEVAAERSQSCSLSVGRFESKSSCDQESRTWNWPRAKADDSCAYVCSPPASSRPVSPLSQAASLRSSPEVSLSPSPPWGISRGCAAAKPARSLTPNSWKALARRAEREGRAQAAAEIALLRMNVGLPASRQEAQAQPERPLLNSLHGVQVVPPVDPSLSSISTSAGSPQSSPRMDRERSKPRTPRRCQKDRTPSPRQPLRLDKDTTREKSNWSPCKWPPSSRWPSTQLPQNVNNWPLAKGDKPTGLETWTHLLFSTGLRCSPSETPYACGKCGTRTETWHLEDRPISPRLGRAPIRSLTPRLRERKQHEAEAKLRAREVRPRSPRARSASPRGPRGPRGRHVQRSLSSSVSATGAKHRAKGREHAMPPKSSKPSPADLARLQQELKAQIALVNRALDGASAPLAAKRKPYTVLQPCRDRSLKLAVRKASIIQAAELLQFARTFATAGC
ncbi:unnamed protein product [Durusdinium trenchii]|uniref:Uncharacterized protein n=1 Tax=Durusdinium trenchii TaxID=1381693 RepID=A0ABP0IEC3_9DINO